MHQYVTRYFIKFNAWVWPSLLAAISGTCASIGYTTRCCPPDEDCMAVDNSAGTDPCYCSSDCHVFGDCCSDIVNVCPRCKWNISNLTMLCCYKQRQYSYIIFLSIAPRTCTELGFVDRCCEDPMSLGFCEIESSSCSCKQSCFIDNNCCPEIGCSRMCLTQYI